MSTDHSPSPRAGGDEPPDDLSMFISLLNQLKSTGCNLLVAGDVPREVFARASARLLGDDGELRYRVLAVTDASPQSIADRLPDPDATPRPLTETTRILNHTGAPRSVTSATDPTTPPELAGIREDCVADPELRGLQSALADAIAETENRAGRLRPADLRVCIDSLGPLLDHYGTDVVRRCLDAVGGHVRERDAMAHYVLADAYDSDRVQTLVPNVDAVIELRTVDPDEFGHDVQQRWHVPRRDITTEWTPL